MAPVISTCRPIVTPERAAFAVAAIAVASSLFLAFGRTEAATSSQAVLACAEHTAAAATATWQALWSEFEVNPLRLQ